MLEIFYESCFCFENKSCFILLFTVHILLVRVICLQDFAFFEYKFNTVEEVNIVF